MAENQIAEEDLNRILEVISDESEDEDDRETQVLSYGIRDFVKVLDPSIHPLDDQTIEEWCDRHEEELDNFRRVFSGKRFGSFGFARHGHESDETIERFMRVSVYHLLGTLTRYCRFDHGEDGCDLRAQFDRFNESFMSPDEWGFVLDREMPVKAGLRDYREMHLYASAGNFVMSQPDLASGAKLWNFVKKMWQSFIRNGRGTRITFTLLLSTLCDDVSIVQRQLAGETRGWKVREFEQQAMMKMITKILQSFSLFPEDVVIREIECCWDQAPNDVEQRFKRAVSVLDRRDDLERWRDGHRRHNRKRTHDEMFEFR